MAKASEPEPASESAYDATISAASRGRYLRFLLRRGPAQQRVVADGVLHVHDDAGRGIHRGKLLHRQHRLEERAALPAVFLGDLDAHQAHLEKLADDVLAEHAGFVHFAHMRPDFLARELAHRGLEKALLLAQRRERKRRHVGTCTRSHVRRLLPFWGPGAGGQGPGNAGAGGGAGYSGPAGLNAWDRHAGRLCGCATPRPQFAMPAPTPAIAGLAIPPPRRGSRTRYTCSRLPGAPRAVRTPPPSRGSPAPAGRGKWRW